MINITVPKFIYDSLMEDAKLIRHLQHYRGQNWIDAVKKEMESDIEFKLGAFKESNDRK